MASATYQVVEIKGWAAGCGTSYRETRAYVARIADGKLVREVGPTNCKWADKVRAKAADLCDRMNARAAA